MKEKKEERQINQGKQTEMNAAKIKQQIFERRICEQARLTCNKQLNTERTHTNNLQIMQYITFTDCNEHSSTP